MNDDELKAIMQKIEGELNGDPEHDAEILNEWGERYREQPGSEPLLHAIGRRIFDLIVQEDPDLPQQIFDDMLKTADEDYADACRLIEKRQYEEALSKLLVLSELIRNYPLPEGNIVWTDFNSYLDSLVYQDYFSGDIGEREVSRHPMHPAQILYTLGSLLIEMNRPEEAKEPLERLLSLDPVCPKYIFELGEAYKRTGQFQDAYNNAIWALQCVSNRMELARAYRDMAFCLSESGAYEDAVMLYHQSLRYFSSRHAEAEIAWIRRNTGVSLDGYNDETIMNRCRELNIPVGISETVQRNIDLLKLIGEMNS